jgi:hypothetical protein
VPQNTNTQCPEAILATIPWYPHGLTREECGAVESHAADCRSCRAELAFLRGDEEPAFELPDADRVYARVLERIRAEDDRAELAPVATQAPRPLGRRMLARARNIRRRIVQPVGIAAGLLVATTSGMLTVGVIWVAREAPSYETAIAAMPPVEAGAPELGIVFRPDASAAEIAADLREAGASLSSGPNEFDLYRARLNRETETEDALAKLREAGHDVAPFAGRARR